MVTTEKNKSKEHLVEIGAHQSNGSYPPCKIINLVKVVKFQMNRNSISEVARKPISPPPPLSLVEKNQQSRIKNQKHGKNEEVLSNQLIF